MILLFGLLALLLVLFEEVCLTAAIQMSISGFYLLVLPIGAAMIAAFIGWMMCIGARLERVRNKAVVCLIAVLIGVIAFPSILYCKYKMTYVGTDGYTNFDFEGTPLSDYEIDGEQYTFADYIVYHLKNDALSLGKRGQVQLDPNYTYNWIMMIVRFLTFLIMTPVCALSFLKNQIYCDKCRRYYRKRELLSIPAEEFRKEHFLPDLQDESLIRKWMNGSQGKEYYTIYLSSCPECKRGRVIAEKYRRGSRNHVHLEQFDQSYDIEQSDRILVQFRKIKKNGQLVVTKDLDQYTNSEKAQIQNDKKDHFWSLLIFIFLFPVLSVLISCDSEVAILWLDGISFAAITYLAFFILLAVAMFSLCYVLICNLFRKYGFATRKNSKYRCYWITGITGSILIVITMIVVTIVHLNL